MVPTDLTLGGMLAAGAAASALQSFVDSNADLVMDISQVRPGLWAVRLGSRLRCQCVRVL